MQPFYKEGKYKAEVVNQALGKNTKGTPQFILKCRILSLVNDGGVDENVRQYERSVYMYLSEKAAEYTIQKLKDIGFNGASIRQLDLEHQNAHDFRAQVIELDCRYDEDQNGDMREKWDLAFAGSGEIEITPLNAAETRKLDALFGKSLAAPAKTQVKANGTQAPATAVENAVVADDDIPF